MITAFHHPDFAAPIGGHVMPMQKFQMVADGLRGNARVRIAEPAPLTEEMLLRVHTPEYVAAVRTGQPRALAESQKFPWSPELFRSVCLTGGGVLAAGAEALRTGASAALASGFHHACSDHGEGFCTFNSLIVASEELRARSEVERVAILDLDLHYGNGTAALADPRAWIFALSLYGNDFSENVCFRDVTRRQHEDGANHRSFALPAGCDRRALLDSLDAALPLTVAHRPDLIFFQAGADSYFEDPFSPLALDHDDLLARDGRVFEFAHACGIPIAWVLAGGYTPDTRKVVRVHLNTFRAYFEVYGG